MLRLSSRALLFLGIYVATCRPSIAQWEQGPYTIYPDTLVMTLLPEGDTEARGGGMLVIRNRTQPRTREPHTRSRG